MRVKERRLRRDLHTKRIETNEEVRARFEKEAHDRERLDIDVVVDVHRRFVNRNSMMELMTKNTYEDRLKEYKPNNNLE